MWAGAGPRPTRRSPEGDGNDPGAAAAAAVAGSDAAGGDGGGSASRAWTRAEKVAYLLAACRGEPRRAGGGEQGGEGPPEAPAADPFQTGPLGPASLGAGGPGVGVVPEHLIELTEGDLAGAVRVKGREERIDLGGRMAREAEHGHGAAELGAVDETVLVSVPLRHVAATQKSPSVARR